MRLRPELAGVRLAAAIALLAGAWLSSGAAPLLAAAAGALDPADFARDYVIARARLADGRDAPAPEGEDGNRRAVEFGAPVQRLYGAPYHAHPPPARLVVRPLGLLSWRGAALVWATGSLLALGWLAISLLRIAAPEREPARAQVALAFVVLALWPPALHCLEKGQWSIWLAALLAAGFVALERDRQGRAGVFFALAAVFKATPIVILGVLVLRFRRAARAMAATLAIAILASLAVDGVTPWRAFLGGAARNATIWAPWDANTASLAAISARLFGAPGPFATPWLAAPQLAAGLFDLAALAFVLAAFLALRRSTRPSPSALAAWLALPVLLNPLGWSHVLLMLLVPLAVALREGDWPTQRTALGAVVVLSIPRATLARLAGPLPVPPGRGLVLGLHAVAAVALFVALLANARPKRPAPAPAQS
jgi:hypothetical protein